ncbi:MAG TPA: hypothetical protein VHO25_07900, partial [Polyangiaceae bacterium]|nr:hypothetical protein [Polyangiaceae bacterium]
MSRRSRGTGWVLCGALGLALGCGASQTDTPQSDTGNASGAGASNVANAGASQSSGGTAGAASGSGGTPTT